MKINKPATTIIFLLISLILFFLFIVPKYKESSYLEASLSQKKAQYNDQAGYYRQLTKAVLDIESNKDSLEKINSALPSNYSISPIIYFFQEKAGKNGLAIESITFSKAAESTSKEVKDISFTVSLSGKYQDFKKFLASLDKSARLFEVNTISFESSEPPGDSSPSSNQQGNQLDTYYFKLEIKTHSY